MHQRGLRRGLNIWYRSQRQIKNELGPILKFLIENKVTTQILSDSLAYIESKTVAFVVSFSAHVVFCLEKGWKQERSVDLIDAYPIVSDLDLDSYIVFFYPLCESPYWYFYKSIFIGKFDGILKQVHQNLLDSHPVNHQVLFLVLALYKFQIHSQGLSSTIQQFDRRLDHIFN